MNTEVERLFQEIGNHLLDVVGADSPRILAYAEVEDGVVSVNVFYTAADGKDPVFKFGDDALCDHFYALWIEWTSLESNDRWRSASYFIEKGKPSLSVVYNERFDEAAGESERRDATLEKYFGTRAADYSRP